MLRRVQPDLRIIALSGEGSASGVAGNAFTAALLSKPVTASTLLDTVHRALHPAQAPAAVIAPGNALSYAPLPHAR
jgi:FixJ family two-component response regulator